MESRADTIAAIATAPGRAGVAVVRVSGPDAYAIAEAVAGRPVRIGLQFVRTVLDECVVLGFRAPKSYTGEDVVEFQCHGGAVVPRRILEALTAAGARLARRGEFTERAFLNGKLDYDQAESVLDLINAKTVRAAEAAREGLAGRKQRELRTLYERALNLSTTLEHALDVSEEELPDAFTAQTVRQLAEFRAVIDAAIRLRREGRILREGALVVLCGPPNAGKSSLMNALLETNRAIVSEVAGTTRDSIEEWMDLGGYPIRLVDTAGLRETDDRIEAEGVKRAEALIAAADVVLRLTPIDANEEDPRLGDRREIRVRTKGDLCPSSADARASNTCTVSAKTGVGLPALKAAIVAALTHAAEGLSADSGSADDRELGVLLDVAARLKAVPTDLVLLGNLLRRIADDLGALIGATYSEDLLDRLFSRFCVGK